MTTEMPRDLTGHHALVCGASAGIGRAAARALAARGAALTLLARRKDRLVTLANELRTSRSGEVHVVALDLDDVADVADAIAAHLESHGPATILVNNTGGPASGAILTAEADAFRSAFNRHVIAAHRLTQTLLPGMKSAGYGRIINVLSTSVREPIPGLGVSNTIRAAMAGWAKSVSRELPPGITINNVLPGYTDTERLTELKNAVAERRGISPEAVHEAWIDMVPERRLARPEELGDVIAFLASPQASYIRGQSLAVDGGRLNGI